VRVLADGQTDRQWQTDFIICPMLYAIAMGQILTLIYGRIAEIFASQRKSGLRNTMVTSYFRPEVVVWPFHACAMKTMQYNLIYGRIAEIFASCKKSGPRNTIL